MAIFGPAVFYTTEVSPQGIVAADFNRDGILDLAETNFQGEVGVLLGNGDGTFQDAQYYIGGPYAYGIAVVDFNEDGYLDIAVTSRYSGSRWITILLGNGDGTFKDPLIYHFSYPDLPIGIVAADFNGDGKMDLAVSTAVSTGGISYNALVMLGKGDGTFQAPVSYGVWGGSTEGIVAADFNNDGKIDLAITDQRTNYVTMLLGNGDGTFRAASLFSVGDSSFDLVAGDFNGDGKLDLAVTNPAANKVSLLFGKGDGTFQTATSFSLSTGPKGITSADIDGDGVPDLIVAVSGSNAVAVLLGNGDGSFQDPLFFSVVTSPNKIVAADFNGDGKIEIAVTNEGSNNIAVLAAPQSQPLPQRGILLFD